MASSVPKILVIDDETAILRLLETLLGRARYEVISVESAPEALRLLEQNTYDCAITDAIMPELSGYDLVKIIRADPRLSELPVLMLTRKRHRQDVKKAVEAGVTDYILKPIDEGLLLEKIDLCLKKGGKHFTRELQLSGSQAEAELGLACKIASLGESSLTLYLPYRIEPSEPVRLHTGIFADIGVGQPRFKLESCEMKSLSGLDSRYSWEARLSYEGVPATDTQKIREWVIKKSVNPV